MKRKTEPSGDTERGWIQERRRQVQAKVQEQGACRDPAPVLPDAAKAELEFQREGRMERKLQALKDGHLLPEEADEELESFIQHLAAKKSALLNPPDLSAGEKKRDLLYRGPSKPWFLQDAGQARVPAFICAGVSGAVRPAQDLGMQMVNFAGDADVVIATDLKSLPELVQLCAVLRGSYVLDLPMLRGRPGLCLKFKGVGHLKRHVWLSRAFKQERDRGFCFCWTFYFSRPCRAELGDLLSPSIDEILHQEHEDFYAVMRKVVDDCLRKTSWRWLESVDDFVAGKGMTYVALVTEDEKNMEARLCSCLTAEPFVGPR